MIKWLVGVLVTAGFGIILGIITGIIVLELAGIHIVII